MSDTNLKDNFHFFFLHKYTLCEYKKGNKLIQGFRSGKKWEEAEQVNLRLLSHINQHNCFPTNDSHAISKGLLDDTFYKNKIQKLQRHHMVADFTVDDVSRSRCKHDLRSRRFTWSLTNTSVQLRSACLTLINSGVWKLSSHYSSVTWITVSRTENEVDHFNRTRYCGPFVNH